MINSRLFKFATSPPTVDSAKKNPAEKRVDWNSLCVFSLSNSVQSDRICQILQSPVEIGSVGLTPSIPKEELKQFTRKENLVHPGINLGDQAELEFDFCSFPHATPISDTNKSDLKCETQTQLQSVEYESIEPSTDEISAPIQENNLAENRAVVENISPAFINDSQKLVERNQVQQLDVVYQKINLHYSDTDSVNGLDSELIENAALELNVVEKNKNIPGAPTADYSDWSQPIKELQQHSLHILNNSQNEQETQILRSQNPYLPHLGLEDEDIKLLNANIKNMKSQISSIKYIRPGSLETDKIEKCLNDNRGNLDVANVQDYSKEDQEMNQQNIEPHGCELFNSTAEKSVKSKQSENSGLSERLIVETKKGDFDETIQNSLKVTTDTEPINIQAQESPLEVVETGSNEAKLNTPFHTTSIANLSIGLRKVIDEKKLYNIGTEPEARISNHDICPSSIPSEIQAVVEDEKFQDSNFSKVEISDVDAADSIDSVSEKNMNVEPINANEDFNCSIELTYTGSDPISFQVKSSNMDLSNSEYNTPVKRKAVDFEISNSPDLIATNSIKKRRFDENMCQNKILTLNGEQIERNVSSSSSETDNSEDQDYFPTQLNETPIESIATQIQNDRVQKTKNIPTMKNLKGRNIYWKKIRKTDYYQAQFGKSANSPAGFPTTIYPGQKFLERISDKEVIVEKILKNNGIVVKDSDDQYDEVDISDLLYIPLLCESPDMGTRIMQNIFQSFGFLISLSQSSNNQSDPWLSNKELVSSEIVKHGGSVYTCLKKVYKGRQKTRFAPSNIILLTVRPVRTKKFLLALSIGIPIISVLWIKKCIQMVNNLFNLDVYS
jgi:hypothetical protein